MAGSRTLRSPEFIFFLFGQAIVAGAAVICFDEFQHAALKPVFAARAPFDIDVEQFVLPIRVIRKVQRVTSHEDGSARTDKVFSHLLDVFSRNFFAFDVAGHERIRLSSMNNHGKTKRTSQNVNISIFSQLLAADPIIVDILIYLCILAAGF